jgi:DNA-binding transcriptional regulator YiaG
MTGDKLRRLRRDRLKMSQVKLAERLGTTVTTVARWERGERGISEIVVRFVALLVDVEGRPAKHKRR